MKLLTDLFSTDYGLMGINGIAFMRCMMVFLIRLFLGKIDESAAARTSVQTGPGTRPQRPHRPSAAAPGGAGAAWRTGLRANMAPLPSMTQPRFS